LNVLCDLSTGEIAGEIHQKLSEKAPDDMEVGEIYQNRPNFSEEHSVSKTLKKRKLNGSLSSGPTSRSAAAAATPPIVSEVIQKYKYRLHIERSPAVPVSDPYRHPLPQFVGLIDMRQGKDSLECWVVETIECIWPEASREVRLLGSCRSWRALPDATIVVWADQPVG
jgi:hypothetical protein